MSFRLLAVPFTALALFAPAHAARADGAKPAEYVVCTYSVADLVVPIDMDNDPGKPADRTTREDVLIRAVTTVAPESWADVGGKGTVQYFPLGMALVVNQTPQIQAEIRKLLTALRRLQDTELAVEIRIVHVSDAVLEKLGKCGAAKRCRAAGAKTLAVLDDAGLRRFLTHAQGDRSVCITQAPKMTVFNGQRAAFRCTEDLNVTTDVELCREEGRVVLRPKTETVTTGIECAVRPVASADRRTVKMRLEVSHRTFAGMVNLTPVVAAVPGGDGQEKVTPSGIVLQAPATNIATVEATLEVPDGKTAVLHAGTVESEVRNEFGPPVISKIPYLKRLKNVGYSRERKHVLVLVTPRVIVQEQEEQIYLGNLMPIPR